ncbi:importin alpha isoform 4 [Hibiscus trionum]|uniref:Importin subunit alpha n=1 Tax=Hibiscus trionum TaxID=183268 RepID=A0A9W7MN59_HIBTR|nr:importin alpha isoform 4 [Hibiscus trionum]
MGERESRRRRDGEVRKKEYKSLVLDADEGRRRRDESLVGIRRSRREERLLKKRREAHFIIHHFTPNISIPNLMVMGVSSHDPALQLEATTLLRKLLSMERCPPIQQVIEAGIVPRLVDFLDNHHDPQLQFEASWALINIASGTSEHTHVVIEQGAVPKFVQLLGSSITDVREQAVWALGNIAGDSPKSRDIVLNHGGLIPLLAQLSDYSKLSPLRNATWALLNFCRGKPPPPFHQVKPALQALQRLIRLNDEEILTDACWALSYLSDGTNEKIQAVIEAGICPQLVELLRHPSEAVLVPALRTIGNIVTGDDSQTQVVIDNQGLPCLYKLVSHNYKKCIKKEACWTISNITAGNTTQLQAVIDANIISPLIHLLQHAEFEIKKEAAWAISNATSTGSHQQIQYMVKQGCVKPLCDLLVCPDPRIVTICLEGLDNILKIGEADSSSGRNIYTEMIEECNGLEKIEDLQSHNNNDIYNKAVKMLERYWLEEEEEGHHGNSHFSFGFDPPSLWRFEF